MKTIAEQIRDLENTRAAKAARMQDVLQKSIDEGRSTEDGEAEEFDTIELEVKQIDEDLVRLHKLAQMSAQSAKPLPVDAGRSASAASGSRGPTILIAPKDAPEKFEGQTFIRSVIAKAVSHKMQMNPIDYAQQRWGKSNPGLVEWMKTDVLGLANASALNPGYELTALDYMYTGDFITYLYSKTLYNQLPLREVPANVYIKGQDGAATGYWVGQGAAIPVSKPDFSGVLLAPLKVGAMTVVTNELLRDSSPSAEMLVRDSLVEALRQRIDTTFISTTAASALVSPAGILNNIPGTTSAGTDTTGLLNDIKELKTRFINAKNSGGLAWCMNPSLACAIGLTRNALGQKEFTEINEDGGRLEGNPVYVSDTISAVQLILLKPSDIWKIGNGPLEVSISEHATIEMADNPSGNTISATDQSQAVVGMFQAESTAIKAVQSMNFQRRRTSAVAWIKDAAYGGSVST
jgi:hypothetical protein